MRSLPGKEKRRTTQVIQRSKKGCGMKPLQVELKMNKLESSYASQLEILKRAGEIIDYAYESIKFQLAYKCFYTPDFIVVYSDRFEFHETKGFMRDDASVKIKTAARLYPWFRFKIIKRENRQWKIIEVKT